MEHSTRRPEGGSSLQPTPPNLAWMKFRLRDNLTVPRSGGRGMGVRLLRGAPQRAVKLKCLRDERARPARAPARPGVLHRGALRRPHLNRCFQTIFKVKQRVFGMLRMDSQAFPEW